MVNMNNALATPSRWYKNRWPWLLMLMPALAVGVGVAFIWQAIVVSDPLIDEHYYAAGQSINRVIHAGKRAQALGLEGKVTFDFSQRHIVVQVNNPHAVPLSPVLSMRLTHPTMPNLDQTIVLSSITQGRYEGVFTVTQAHRWTILVSDPRHEWSLSAEWHQVDGNQAHLTPTAVHDPAEG